MKLRRIFAWITILVFVLAVYSGLKDKDSE